MDGDAESGEIAGWLLELLVCPVDHTKVELDNGFLVCPRCGRRYAVHDGIPVMIPEADETEQKF